ncbi:hypothetical protein HPP92_011169 [Vanilla planifolia]|uniref:14-3-3 domain-containing protein n=1 Tax=Vanilla planifolia TaxID=51239 RepID=A0A835V246_VANPL|nr:hypothetical protein HPP92_011169 [Vanilla planifolia]
MLMWWAVKKIARMDVELTVEERNLLQVGYKNVVGVMRDSWQILSSIEQKEEAKGNAQNVRRVKGYIKLVEDELNKAAISTTMTDLPLLIQLIGLTLNLSMLYYEILDSLKERLSSLEIPVGQGGTLVMQLLRITSCYESDLPEEKAELCMAKITTWKSLLDIWNNHFKGMPNQKQAD